MVRSNSRLGAIVEIFQQASKAKCKNISSALDEHAMEHLRNLWCDPSKPNVSIMKVKRALDKIGVRVSKLVLMRIKAGKEKRKVDSDKLLAQLIALYRSVRAAHRQLYDTAEKMVSCYLPDDAGFKLRAKNTEKK